MARAKLGLALGGGGARGLAHLGVLRVLERNEIAVDCIAGCSIGAMVGGLYALSGDARKVANDLQSYFSSEEFAASRLADLRRHPEDIEPGFFDQLGSFVRRGWMFGTSFARSSVIEAGEVTPAMERLVPTVPIEELRIPFVASALDLMSGKTVYLREGSLRDAISASAAIPGVFPPMRFGEAWLADGSWADPMPVPAVRHLGAEVVLAVDVAIEPPQSEPPRRGVDVVMRAYTSAHSNLKELLKRDAELVLEPATGAIHWAAFDEVEAAIAAGEAAMREMLPRLKELLKPRWRLWS